MNQKQIYITAENINKFIDRLKNEERTNSTAEKYARDLKACSTFLNGTAVTKKSVIEWKESLSKTHEPTSVNSMIAAINGFCAFFKFDIKLKPLKIQQKLFLYADRELTEEDYEKLLRAAKEQGNERICFAMQTLCATGIRVSELKSITMEAVIKGSAEIKNKGKIRTILIPSDLAKVLLEYAKKYHIKSGAVFVTKSGKPIHRSNIWADMKKLCALAGVDPNKVKPHALRSLFARTFLSVVNNIAELKSLMGHSKFETTLIYLKKSGSELRKSVERLNLVKINW
ncbi:MAG: tyrosine-type recombinase/integrase [Oscillospiraceae bacterium]|nr:tyrosine-type recombinase/integrase [Oscillospiraceae bacterium]